MSCRKVLANKCRRRARRADPDSSRLSNRKSQIQSPKQPLRPPRFLNIFSKTIKVFFYFYFFKPSCNYKVGYCCQVTEEDEAATMKAWILRYAQQSSEEEEEEEEKEGEKRPLNPELEERFDPVRERKKNNLDIICAKYRIKC